MPKEQSTFSSLLQIIFAIIGVVLLMHSFFRLVTDLNTYNFNNILTEIFIGFIFIFSPFFRNALVIVSIWLLISMGLVTSITNHFGAIGAFLALVFCVVFPFWAFGKYEDYTSDKANSLKDTKKISESIKKKIQTIESFADEAVTKEDSLIKNQFQLQPKPIPNLLKPLQKDYPFADLNWYRDSDGIHCQDSTSITSNKNYQFINLKWYRDELGVHCEPLYKFYSEAELRVEGLDVALMYKGTLHHVPITKIECWEQWEKTKDTLIKKLLEFRWHRTSELSFIDAENPLRKIKSSTVIVQPGYEGVLVTYENGKEIFVFADDISNFWKY